MPIDSNLQPSSCVYELFARVAASTGKRREGGPSDRRGSNHNRTDRPRPHTLAGALRALRGDADDRPRRDHRQRRPADDSGQPRLLPERPRLGRQRLPDPLRWPAAAGRPPRRPARPAAHVPDRPRGLRRRLAALRRCREPGDADRRPLPRRRRRRARLGGDPGDDRDDVPRAARAGESDRRLRLRRLGRRLDRPASRRHPDPGDQLALDLRDQPADRHRHRLRGDAPGRGQVRPRLQGRRRHSRRGADHQLADDRRLRHPRRQRARLGLCSDTDSLRRLVRPRRGLHHPPGADREPA